MFNDLKLSAKLNISFALALFIPMTVAMVFSIAYFSGKIKNEALTKIKTDVEVTNLLYMNILKEMKQHAETYSRFKYITTLFHLDVGYKIGMQLAEDALEDNLDLITLFDKNGKIISRSHAPAKTGDYIEKNQFINRALNGESGSLVELLNRDAFNKEGISTRLFHENAMHIVTVTGYSPVYDNKKNEIMGGIILRRIQSKDSPFIKRIRKILNVSIALIEKEHILLSLQMENESSGFFIPPADVIKKAYQNNGATLYDDFRKNGHLSMIMPIPGITGETIALFMVQRNINSYIKTRQTAIIILLVIFAVGFILTFIIKTIVVRRIINPVGRLKQGTSVIGKGDYTHHIEVTSKDEIGELTDHFNQMASSLLEYDTQLKVYNRELEQRVEERTKDLSIANEALLQSNQALEDTLEKLNPGVSNLIKNNAQQLGLVCATELVCDVCNYTKLNMILGETLMGVFMKRFFREGHKLLAMYRGMFDKTVGDQIVAVFGTAKDQTPEHDNHPFDAVTCALHLIEVSKIVNRELKEAIEENYTAVSERYHSLSSEDRKTVTIEDLKFQVRIGINTSNPLSDREIDRMRMVMMGAETCVDYTAQGGSVIYAFRLESGGKPGMIHIGENTKRVVEHIYALEEVPSISLKGLGIQPCYRVLGMRPTFENIFPKTRFYREYASYNITYIENMIKYIVAGRVALYEVRKIADPIEVGVSYTEYLAGYHNRAASRAYFYYAVGKSLDMDEELIKTGVFACIWTNINNLKKLLPGSYSFCDPVADDSFGIRADLAGDLIRACDEGDQTRLEAAVISFVNEFDAFVFDRSFTKTEKNKIVSPREALKLLEQSGRYDENVLQKARALFVAEDTIAGEYEMPDMNLPFPRDIKKMTNLLKHSFTAEELEEMAGMIRGNS